MIPGLRPHQKATGSREPRLPESNAFSWPSLSSAVIECKFPSGWAAHLPLTFPIPSGHKKGTKSQERNYSSPLASNGDTYFKSLVVSTEPFPFWLFLQSSAKELSSQESLQTGQLQRGPRRRHHRTSQGLRSSAVQEGAQPMHFYLFVVSP